MATSIIGHLICKSWPYTREVVVKGIWQLIWITNDVLLCIISFTEELFDFLDKSSSIIRQVIRELSFGEVYLVCVGVDDVIKRLICMLQKHEYLCNTMRYWFSKNVILPHMESTSE